MLHNKFLNILDNESSFDITVHLNMNSTGSNGRFFPAGKYKIIEVDAYGVEITRTDRTSPTNQNYVFPFDHIVYLEYFRTK